jgi:DNA-binding MarR family transcriptional regulator
VKRPTTPLTTPGLAAHLTWKQFDIMLLLADGPLNADELSALLTEIREDDLAGNERIFYLGVHVTATRATLYRLEDRGLVARQNSEDREWKLTPAGRSVLIQYETRRS